MLKEIKSKYIIKDIFNILNEGKALHLIRYSKYFQDKLEITEIDYRKYSQIEIEIKLIKNDDEQQDKRKKLYFINEKLKHDFYHVFFDDKREEIERNYVMAGENVKKIKIVIEMEIKSLKELFNDCDSIQSIKFTKFNRSDIIDMSSLFYNCIFLSEIDFKEFKTRNVIDMSHMFYNCSSLKNLDLSKFITNNVINMNNMFSWCESINKLNLSSFNTENVIDMHEMFSCCR